ncbi:excisionase [Alkalibacter mobilis]|uniref:excisionase n=1 Tax=Alkalibacter mobilis TaxID=2787712 RepID=UPI00189D68FA|nr:excisionase [Alkalibacter mobilis]MBF7097604.1 DNA-binding protein [Alkalibacter mobilis]
MEVKTKQLISISEAAKIFGIGRDRLYRLAYTDPTMPIVKIGQYMKVNSVLFSDWLNEATRQGRNL